MIQPSPKKAEPLMYNPGAEDELMVLILKRIGASISPAEASRLSDWLDEHESSRKLLDEPMDLAALDGLAKYCRIDPDQAWQDIARRIAILDAGFPATNPSGQHIEDF